MTYDFDLPRTEEGFEVKLKHKHSRSRRCEWQAVVVVTSNRSLLWIIKKCVVALVADSFDRGNDGEELFQQC